jgi:hypothetical protein
MSDVELRVEVQGGEVLKRFADKLRNPRPALDEAGEVLLRGVRDAFDEGDRGFWQPLADFTVNERSRLGFGPAHPILIRTGEYLASFHVDDTEANAVAIASDDPRFQTLNFGGVTEDGRPVPPRPVVISEAFVNAAVDALIAELLKD